jgi:hypothetical protein
VGGLPGFRSSGNLKIGVTLCLVGGNDGRAAETGGYSSGAVVAALSGAFLELSGDVDGQDGGDESGKEGELHDGGLVSNLQR